MRHLTVVVLATAIGLVGCAHRRISVEQVQTQGVGTAELELLPPPEPEQPSLGNVQKKPTPEASPETVSQALPRYPTSALEDRVACTARLLYHIQTDGSVTIVRLVWDPAPPQDHVEAFESAIRDAAATWEYMPAYRLRHKERDDGTAGFEKQLIPKARRAVIRFRVEGGQAVVE